MLPNQPIEIVKNIVRQGINDTTSIKEARATADKINLGSRNKIPGNELRDLILDSFGFKRLNISSPILIEDGFFEISYQETWFYTWNEYILTIEDTKAESMAIRDAKGKILLKIKAIDHAKTLNYIIFLSEDGGYSLYKSTESGIVEIITSNLGINASYISTDIVEASNNSIYLGFHSNDIVIVKKYDGKKLSDFFLTKDGETKFFYKNEEEKTEIMIKYHGLGYRGLYAGGSLYSYDAYIETPTVFDEDMIFKVESTNNLGIDRIITTGIDMNIFMKDNKELWRIENTEGVSGDACYIFYILDEKIYDLKSGDLLLSVDEFIYNKEEFSDDQDVIIGISLKEDKSGYYVWINSEILKYKYKMHALNLRGTNSLRNIPPMPEILFHPIAANPLVAIKSYYKNMKEPYKKGKGMPFIVSEYSLYPYYHKLITGENILVKAKEEYGDKYYVSGYSVKGHRIFREYQNNTKYKNFLIYSEDSKLIRIIYGWFVYFLNDVIYLDATREDKIEMVQERVSKIYPSHNK